MTSPGRTPLLGFIHFEKIYRKANPDSLLSCALTANASKMRLALYCGASDATGGAMTDDASIASVNSAVRFRSLDEIGATSGFAQVGRREPLWPDASELTKPSGS
jgi:2-iminoacetate synthase ThiH